MTNRVSEGDNLEIQGELDYPDAWIGKNGKAGAVTKIKPLTTKLYGEIIRPQPTVEQNNQQQLTELAKLLAAHPNVNPMTGEVLEEGSDE